MPEKLESLKMGDFKMLMPDFNRKKKAPHYLLPKTPNLKKMQTLAKAQCLGANPWPEIDKVKAWMISAETAQFMKMGGLGMIASELPEAYNRMYANEGDEIKVVTPLYLGNTGKKKALFEDGVYYGAEGKSAKLDKVTVIEVPFCDEGAKLSNHKVVVWKCEVSGVTYILLENERFFTINPHKENPSAQDGCYVYNANGVNETERFAFFTKAVYVLLKDVYENTHKKFDQPNLMLANDWHSGELSGLLKYLTLAQEEQGLISHKLAEKLRQIPVVHIAHHLGYQGWDYQNTARLLNSMYEYSTAMVYRNAKPIKNTNPRTQNVLVVYDCFNQASCNFHLADRVVTVSKNYLEEVSRFLEFGWDFRDVLKIRKDHGTFVGIVNGYDKVKITPSAEKIKAVNAFFECTDFVPYDENNLEAKNHNKAEFLKLLGKLSSDKAYKEKKLPLVEFYKFDDISGEVKNPAETPIFCATSRMVEQKGYDIAAKSIMKLTEKYKDATEEVEVPVFVMGGAGDAKYFNYLKKLKDEASKVNPKAAKRIFVFRGYKDEFAYAIQLASDFYMMPCRFEPCGLTQMEAMAKGALPVAMSTGGLVDTIINGADGFRTEVFFVGKDRIYGSNLAAQRLKNNVNAYADTLQNILDVFYHNPEIVKVMKKHAMQKDFSWNQGAIQAYHSLFHKGYIA